VLQSMRSTAKYVWVLIAITFVGGFLIAETSGLLGRAPVTSTTDVAVVNGEHIPYVTWENTAQRLEQQQQQRSGRSLTLDEVQRVRDDAFEQLVSDVLLQQEYARRGIGVTDQEIIQEAQTSPPPDLMQDPQLQTEGQFDIEKYRRLLSSPAARAQGALVGLENYYRNQIPREKLFEQLASDVYVTDQRLWSSWQDTHDSAQVTFVAFRPDMVRDSAVKVADAEVQAYYDAHKKEFDRPGRANVSLVFIRRRITAADTATARDHILALRKEIEGGAKFEDVAKRESADSVSAADGGKLGRGAHGRFVPAFEAAADKLKVGELSAPVLTQFGYHLIRVDEHKGDTLAIRHILIRIVPNDSTLARTDREADELSKVASNAEQPARFDSAAKKLGLKTVRTGVIEGQPLTLDGKYVPSVSAWAFGGAQVGESSDLYDSDDGYVMARLDTLVPGGTPKFDEVASQIRTIVAREKKLDALTPKARELAAAALQPGASLESAAKAMNLPVTTTGMFARVGFVPGLGQLNAAIGTAFGLPVGSISAPVRTDEGVDVIRLDRRVTADRSRWEAQKKQQRDVILQQIRQQRVQVYLDNLRKSAKVDDHRKAIEAQLRRQTPTT
jgi:peptidyl-prolyl cis-trans isomerase D